MSLTSENYFEVIHHDGVPILSHSLLKFAMPVNGGSNELIEAAYEKLLVKEDSQAMMLGSMLHKYVEDPTLFVWRPEWEMSDTIKLMADKLWATVSSSGTGEASPSIRTYLSNFNTVAAEVGWGQSWKPETRMNKFVDAAQLYWMFLIESKGKIPVFGNTIEKMKGMIDSISNSSYATPVLYDPEGETEIHRELAIQWEYKGFNMKSMIDILVINKATGIVDAFDLKTTSDKPSQFMYRYTYAGEDKIEKVFLSGPYVKYGYYTQEYLYKKAIKQWLKDNGHEGEWTIRFSFAVIGTMQPYQAMIYRSSNQWMEIAEYEVNAAMDECQLWFNKFYNEKF